jgi:hypothetical protein
MENSLAMPQKTKLGIELHDLATAVLGTHPRIENKYQVCDSHVHGRIREAAQVFIS